jgi:hypothetical protein
MGVKMAETAVFLFEKNTKIANIYEAKDCADIR